MIRTAAMAILLATSFVTQASEGAKAKADPAKGKVIAETVCIACHGADGNSAAAANPHLAIEALRDLLTEESAAVSQNNLVRQRAFSQKVQELMNRYTNSQLTAAEVIAELIAMACVIAASIGVVRTARRSPGRAVGGAQHLGLHEPCREVLVDREQVDALALRLPEPVHRQGDHRDDHAHEKDPEHDDRGRHASGHAWVERVLSAVAQLAGQVHVGLCDEDHAASVAGHPAATCRARAEANLALTQLEFAPPAELFDEEIADVLTREQALANAPETTDGMFRVSSILGEEQ